MSGGGITDTLTLSGIASGTKFSLADDGYGGSFVEENSSPTFLSFVGNETSGTISTISGQVTVGGGDSFGFISEGTNYATFSPPGSTYMEVNDISPFGDIVGDYTPTTTGHSQGFIYSHGIFTDLVEPDGLNNSCAFGINASGQIVGLYTDPSGVQHGYLYSNGQWTTLDYPSTTPLQTVAFDINDEGQIVGAVGALGPDPGWRGFLATPTGTGYTWTTLGSGYATEVNDAGQVIMNGSLDARTRIGSLTTQGRIAFGDANWADTHTASASLLSTTWSGGAEPNGLETALETALTPTILLDSTGTGTGDVDWKFTFDDAFANMLNNGDKFTATYGLTVTDNHGSSVTQNVLVTVLGASDWFHLAGFA